MLELILLVNLAFSITGFVFILRMWKEVKERRDYYGENFGIPKGEEKPPALSPAPVDADAIAAAVAAAMANQAKPEPEPEPEPAQVMANMDDGDLKRIMAAAMAAYKGGGA